MTSQIAISNLNGIAVASDTVVTLTKDGAQKTLGNTNKIYELGGAHNILILHSGTSTINDIPHSLHIYEWAKTLGEPKPTVQAYVDSYKAWTAGETKLSKSASEANLIHYILNDHYYYMNWRIKDEVLGKTYINS
jgi:disulfide oxidoreductase YuzD